MQWCVFENRIFCDIKIQGRWKNRQALLLVNGNQIGIKRRFIMIERDKIELLNLVGRNEDIDSVQ